MSGDLCLVLYFEGPMLPGIDVISCEDTVRAGFFLAARSVPASMKLTKLPSLAMPARYDTVHRRSEIRFIRGKAGIHYRSYNDRNS